MNLSKYKLPMDELPFGIKESLKEDIHNSEFPGFNNAYKLHREGSFSTGICKNNKGEMLVTCITEMPDVTPRMIDWWFGWHLPESERYQLWHPKAHVSSRLTQDNSHFTTDKEKYINKLRQLIHNLYYFFFKLPYNANYTFSPNIPTPPVS